MKKALQTSILMSLFIIPMFFAFTAQAADTDGKPEAKISVDGNAYLELQEYNKGYDRYCKGTKGEDEEKCVMHMATFGRGSCAGFKKANDSLDKFHDACMDAGYEGKLCIQKAAACANLSEDEEGNMANVNEANRLIGLPPEDNNNNSELMAKCARYNTKDYDTRKSELSKELRDAQKDLEATQKDVSKNARDYSTEKRRQIERQTKINENLNKLIDSNQKEAQERAQEMSKSVMDSEKEQAAVRVQNIQAQGEIAKIQAARAQQLSRLTDAMISTDCMTKMDLLLKKWALEGSQTLNGAAALFRSNAEKKRRIQDEHRACIEEGNAARKSSRKMFASQVQAVRDQIKGNDQQSARLEEQKGRLASDYQQFLARQGVSTQEAYSRSQAEMAALQKEAAEIEQDRNQRNQEVAQTIEENRKRINDATREMANMGAKPRGSKTPNEGYLHFRKFMNVLTSYETMPVCKAAYEELARKAKEEVAEYKLANPSGKKAPGSSTTSGSTSKSGAK